MKSHRNHRHRHTKSPQLSMNQVKDQVVVIAFTNGTMDTCIVLDIDYHLHFIKLCYVDDPETMFWRNLQEISSINLEKK